MFQDYLSLSPPSSRWKFSSSDEWTVFKVSLSFLKTFTSFKKNNSRTFSLKNATEVSLRIIVKWRTESFWGRRRSIKVFWFWLLPLWKCATFPQFPSPRPKIFSSTWRYHHTLYLWTWKEQRECKIILGYPLHTNTHSLPPNARPSHIPVYTQWICFVRVPCERKTSFSLPCKYFPVFSLIAWTNKKFLSFEDDPLVIVGSHSKRISSFSKQRPRSFTYIVLLPYFRAAGRSKEK